jgi:hypothetical protein
MSYTNGLDNPELYFQCKTYTGNGGTLAVTLDGSENMSPNLVWIKERNLTSSHALTDTTRGNTKKIKSDDTDAEETNTNLITSFDSDGFTLGDNGNANQSSSQTYVAWCWKETATAGFDIVSYTGNSSDGTTVQDISHSLSAVPHWMLIKNRADATNFAVYHHKNTSAPETEVIYLNATNATSDDSAFFGDTSPTSSQFRVGGDNGVNGNSDAMIAYLWSEKKGFSKFGSYTGNGNADGTFVYTGFRPAMIITKRTDTTGAWVIYDNKRDTFNPADAQLVPSSSEAEATSERFDFLSNGFKLITTATRVNASGSPYIYMAFAESPFVNSKGVPCNGR